MRVTITGMSSLLYIVVYCICAVETTRYYSGEVVQSGTWSVTFGLMAHRQFVDRLPMIHEQIG
eukprot:12938120-Prorocentrum_lima.AAC.1